MPLPDEINSGGRCCWRNQADGAFSNGDDIENEANYTPRSHKARPEIQIRSPRHDDIPGIVDLVQNCRPFLSVHPSYLYWMDIQYFANTCAIAELGGNVVGWCSMIRVSSARYFLHQLGVVSWARRRGIAASLLTYLLQKLKQHHDGDFEIEFTSDRRNEAVLEFNRAIAECMEMRLVRKPHRVSVIEGSEEELYAMVPTKREVSSPSLAL